MEFNISVLTFQCRQSYPPPLKPVLPGKLPVQDGAEPGAHVGAAPAPQQRAPEECAEDEARGETVLGDVGQLGMEGADVRGGQAQVGHQDLEGQRDLV